MGKHSEEPKSRLRIIKDVPKTKSSRKDWEKRNSEEELKKTGKIKLKDN